MKTFDSLIASSKALLFIVLVAGIVLIVGYAFAQSPYVGPYIYSSPTWDRQDQTMGQQRANQAIEQRAMPQWAPETPGLGMYDPYRDQVLQEQRSQSRSLYNMELQNTKPNACGLDPTYRYARPGC